MRSSPFMVVPAETTAPSPILLNLRDVIQNATQSLPLCGYHVAFRRGTGEPTNEGEDEPFLLVQTLAQFILLWHEAMEPLNGLREALRWGIHDGRPDDFPEISMHIVREKRLRGPDASERQIFGQCFA